MLARLRTPLLALPLILALAACGQTPGERAVSGGLIGAGTGALVAGATGGRVGTGALVGAGVGAIGGAITAPDQGYGRGGYYDDRRGYRDDRRGYRDDRGCYDRRGRYVC
jgi:hypothetical protein